MQALLIRKKAQGNAVRGALSLPFGGKYGTLTYPTLENADYLIPAGTYPLELTWSPKFQKKMPEIGSVPGREGIRIHLGTLPEHSTGCVLVNPEALTNTITFVNYANKYSDEETTIQLVDAH